MRKDIVILEHAGLEFQNRFLLKDISFILREGELAVITGVSGSGKTLLGKLMAGQLSPTEGKVKLAEDISVVFVSQQHSYNTSASSRSYYQQRYDSNYGESSPLVEDYLRDQHPGNEKKLHSLLEPFRLEYLLSRRLIQLSNGEGKRLQLILALLKNPQLLVLDSPFTGVDRESRAELFRLFDHIREQGISMVLIAQPDHIPASADHIIVMEKGSVKKISADAESALRLVSSSAPDFQEADFPNELYYNDDDNFSIAVKMDKVSISYEGQRILSDIDWEVRRGERWLIRGANGSGKSMLLSLINGDNPKAFGQDIILFDQKKGSGESIWELKRKIGYISPEMHIHFLRRPEHIVELIDRNEKKLLEDPYQPKVTCKEVITSGFYDQIGFTGSNTTQQDFVSRAWLRFLQMESLANIPFYQMPLGQQRLLLLARALVKNPPLLILDEPCQGLDDMQTALFTRMVDVLCRNTGKTLLYVSHYDKDVPDCIDHLLELEKGFVVRKDKWGK